MPEHGVLISSTWRGWLWHTAIAIVLCLWAVVGLEAVFSIRVIYQNALQIANINSQMTEMGKVHSQRMEEMSMRMDALERVLFGDVLAKVEEQAKVETQAWQKNRDKELRDRITRLELWRLQQQDK